MATDASHPSDLDAELTVPLSLQKGSQLTKISEKSEKKVVFRIEPDEGQILYPSRKHGLVPIESIKEIRTGLDAQYYCCTQFGYSQDSMQRWMTIVYVLNSNYKTLHILAPTKDVFDLWETTIRKLYAIRLGLMHNLDNVEIRQTVWERQYWKSADKGGDQSLNLDEIQAMCVRLSVNYPPGELKDLFNAADARKTGSLNFPEFQQFVKLLRRRPELEALYKKLCGDQQMLDFAAFERFMTNTQKSSLTSSELKLVFEKYATSLHTPVPALSSSAPSPAASAPVAPPINTNPVVETPPTTPLPPITATGAPSDMPGPTQAPSDVSAGTAAPTFMSTESFASFLVSEDNAPIRPESNDMTQPMSDYFISTSHNTYLVGNQLMGVSTIEGYIRALLCSCRSVEMDIYDGTHEPMVYHGKTLTSQVSAREICQAIAKYAFVSSPYPVLLSCEIHCGLAQQDALVEMMTKTFGTALVKAPLEAHPKKTVLPSPELLKGRILIKTKNLYVAAELDKAQKTAATALKAESSSESSSESESEVAVVMEELGELKSELKSKWNKMRGIPSSTTGGVDSKAKPKIKPPMSMALASLLVYTVGVKCRGIDKTKQYAPEQIFSLSESKANKFIQEGVGMEDLIRHTQTHVVRIYPKGTRVNSTNYEPLQYWAAGCQLVALNVQTMDLGYRINQAMFMRSGRQGYVLKPLALRDPHFQELRKHTKHFLDVTIISAQQLPRPRDSSGKEIVDKSIIDPYIEVALHIPDWSNSPFLPANKNYDHDPPSGAHGGSATSGRTISFSTRAVKNNGFNPMWQEELCLPFDCIGGMKELIFAEFTVRQENKADHEPLARFIAPLSSLHHGFRHLSLHDSQLCQHLFSTLFVYITIRDVA
ncbi:1-phosphatidylinositol-4,5-bisphosphate phosphodiesterase 1 [Mycena belliarum]|uniref:Phosphoinositide phospholipase C n=1 Tax=Mycena belliarum TaxID=1033014 RepID=A0AAD6TR16_9AGAR|nr:1-phosphatidylinositol-4,5-bisphosphate phosphodiesterase 1 [Mycena belliae]